MQKIKQLPLSEIQKIAAGQVVERPANIVKELLENAIDAGATKITLYIEAGGQRLIRVVDNGSGMSDVDALVCFERHATSKITAFEQLQSLQTFGFRGEALYTIGAVSTVTLITKEQDALQGIKVFFNQGNLISTDPISSVCGTDISVEDIFANVPARKKFLKKEETEYRVILQLFQAFCFSYPGIHLQLFSDNKLVYNCPPVVQLVDRAAQVWDVTSAQDMISVQSSDDVSITISGIISHQHLFRYNRNQMFFFVNKRWVKNFTLGQALLKGYLNVLPPARYPVAIIALTIDPTLVDVNIHPRKEEVRFIHEKQIENALSIVIKKRFEEALSERIDKDRQQQVPEARSFFENQQQFPSSFFMKENFFESKPLSFFGEPQPNLRSSDVEVVVKSEEIPRPLQFEEFPSNQFPSYEAPEEKSQQEPLKFEEESYEVIGVLKKTYILLDHPDGIVYVDQHAAHERILFEQFSKRFSEISSIKLMFPEMITLPQHEVKLLMDHAIMLHEQGIMFDQWGVNQIVIQSIPVHLKSVAWPVFLREVIDLLSEHASLEKEEFFTIVNKKLQAQMACKAAVKAGDSLTAQQIHQLLRDLNGLDNRFTCPHGRPTSWLLPLYDIEKKFKRKL